MNGSPTARAADADRSAIAPVRIPPDLIADLRSDHAGEAGAVFIYRGILGVTRDAEVRCFAEAHLETECRHLALMGELVPVHQRSRLLPVWRIAGWITGALPAIFGPAAVYRTIDAVESFVDRHYAKQVDKLRGRTAYAELGALLEVCRLDEVGHRDEARSRGGRPAGVIGRWWSVMVRHGSAVGVALAKRF